MIDLPRYQPPLVAILRGLTLFEAEPLGRTLFGAGFRIVEVPLNRRSALDCIEALRAIAPEDALIGAGTVLSTADVDNVVAAGGQLMVSPNADADVMRRARERGLCVVPGVATPTEAFNALRWRADALKIFPADMVGMAGLKAFKSVLPSGTLLWPVGGVTPESLQAWVQAGANGFGIGGQLYQTGMAVEALERRAREFMDAWRRALPVADPPVALAERRTA
jgi:2-dehydro-3-deoxyphosphogalactonate aldolase